HAAIGRMAYVILPVAALDVASPDEQILDSVTRISKRTWVRSTIQQRMLRIRSREAASPIGGKQRIFEEDAARAQEVGIAHENAAGRDLRHRMVVMKHEFGIRAHFRGDVEVAESAERVLFRRAAVVVERSEVERIRSGAVRPRVARSIGDRKGTLIEEKAAGI